MSTTALAQASLGCIDVHHHFYPKFLMDEWANAPASSAEWASYKTIFMRPPFLGWTPEKVVALLDGSGIATAILSLPDGTLAHAGPGRLPETVRRCNEFATEMARDFPSRFGLFAILPMPNIDRSLEEVAYAFDVLGVTGIGLMTNYGDRWLGDPSFRPVLAELNRRRAVVHVHPKVPTGCRNLMKTNPLAAATLLEYPFDTVRTLFDLLQGGSFVEFRDIDWIFSHCGGVMPMMAGRLRDVGRSHFPEFDRVAPHGLDHELQRLHYDTAASAYSPNIRAATDYFPLANIVFGTDYPHIGVERTVSDMNGVGLDAAALHIIQTDNARRLLSRLAQLPVAGLAHPGMPRGSLPGRAAPFPAEGLD